MTLSKRQVRPAPIEITFIQTKNTNTREYTLCLLKAVDPQQEQKVSNLAQMITRIDKSPVGSKSHSPAIWDLLSAKTIFIGESLAQHLHVSVGDTVTVLYPEQGTVGRKVSLRRKKLPIAALFKTGIHDFDEHVIVSSFALAEQLYPAAIRQVTITLKNPRQEQMVIASLKKRLSLPVLSWKDLYPSLVSAVILEKYVMLFILLLVSLVASLNIISLLCMYVAQKRAHIAILKTLGMTDKSLISIFLLLSSCITLSAAFGGILPCRRHNMASQYIPFH